MPHAASQIYSLFNKLKKSKRVNTNLKKSQLLCLESEKKTGISIIKIFMLEISRFLFCKLLLILFLFPHRPACRVLDRDSGFQS